MLGQAFSPGSFLDLVGNQLSNQTQQSLIHNCSMAAYEIIIQSVDNNKMILMILKDQLVLETNVSQWCGLPKAIIGSSLMVSWFRAQKFDDIPSIAPTWGFLHLAGPHSEWAECHHHQPSVYSLRKQETQEAFTEHSLN